MKKNQKNKKPRTPIIHVELREDTNVNWNQAENRLEFLDSKGGISKKNLVSIGEGYDRPGKGPKVLRQLMSRVGAIVPFNVQDENFDRYLAVDTSYKTFGENFMCVTACVSVETSLRQKKELVAGDQLDVRVLPRLCFLSKTGVNPERYGWMRMIKSLQEWENYNQDLSYGLVVDSELGLLPKMNAREEPILEDFYLPANMSLIYASAEAGNDYFYNLLLKQTDKIAAKSLEATISLFSHETSYSLGTTYQDVTVLNDEVPFEMLENNLFSVSRTNSA